ncbi:MAG: hypothetical protein ACD_52C00020G0005 [uncultured bacterium]|uniref:Elongation factor P n=1 Tax=Candidatus Woesebacteria bacterium RIFCSPHIGHO2_12_FULL_41_24 TaxID=1802510 RepID=A0A1F8AQX7_9BACT|nr:MAG: hypothetical protein ACD_52C00020G0005 [uncultured bacterium]OGM13401.1 MAG: elongation factor P [Candidatus Woesebacteria bacterium RBG_16_41_13]OGM30497.1 MAG: elongation factor P [Candidatus Woesebacteria bacterium RIFCSPHIGHO2_01_FULL_42_80]OGM35945.1 MAG: elongation factor P [Candidatus Woesebacteria bacterium RIFCSPHIGHO2_02_FULL_42_20]OGM54163.1 MAG: elongation factor P [Candidatus Woesebacteria bacterium RIFCSPHIGHO2_12_FULL_41_24]OGM66499.1 MAG: elongation factor P [Candidatus
MISVTDLRSGKTFVQEGKPYVVVKYEHKKLGRGNAVIKLQVRNLITGGVKEIGFNSGASVDDINITKRQLQYLYTDKSGAVFMDPITFEQIEIPLPAVKEQLVYVKEGESVNVLFWAFGGTQDKDDLPLSLELPPKVTLTVAETDPGVKGNSASNVYKSATLENGLKVKVPLFIKKGEKVRVDTRTGEYLERSS